MRAADFRSYRCDYAAKLFDLLSQKAGLEARQNKNKLIAAQPRDKVALAAMRLDSLSDALEDAVPFPDDRSDR